SCTFFYTLNVLSFLTLLLNELLPSCHPLSLPDALPISTPQSRLDSPEHPARRADSGNRRRPHALPWPGLARCAGLTSDSRPPAAPENAGWLRRQHRRGGGTVRPPMAWAYRPETKY